MRTKRAYDKKAATDGTRILVDRLWPRGLSKEAAAINEWLKLVSPSNELRVWFGHEPDKFPEFRASYIKELAETEKAAALKRLAVKAAGENVTLIYGAKDREHNHAVVLAELIGKLMMA